MALILCQDVDTLVALVETPTVPQGQFHIVWPNTTFRHSFLGVLSKSHGREFPVRVLARLLCVAPFQLLNAMGTSTDLTVGKNLTTERKLL
jgi:hypothetical protein